MSAHTVSVEQAREQLEELIVRVEAGDDIVIVRGDRPLVRLMPIHGGGPRLWGVYRNMIEVPADFDDPLGAEFWLGGES